MKMLGFRFSSAFSKFFWGLMVCLLNRVTASAQDRRWKETECRVSKGSVHASGVNGLWIRTTMLPHPETNDGHAA